MYEIELNGTPVATCDTQDEASRWRDRLVKSIRREFPGYTGYRITVVEIDERGSRRKAAPAA